MAKAWRRLDIQPLYFCGLRIDTEITLIEPKYGVRDNEPTTRKLHIEHRHIDNMIARLTAKGWHRIAGVAGRVTLILDPELSPATTKGESRLV